MAGRGSIPRRHPVAQFGATRPCVELGYKHGGVAIIPLLCCDRAGGGKQPVAAVRVVEQRRKDTGRIEARPWQPHQATIHADEGGSMQIADQTMVVNRKVGHVNPNCCAFMSDSVRMRLHHVFFFMQKRSNVS